MEMTRRQLFWLSLGALPVAAKGVLDWQRENLLIADSLQRSRSTARLFRLGGKASGQVFHAYPVRGQAALSASARSQLLSALIQSLRVYSITDGVSATFTPGYGVRLENEADLVISFQTNQLYYLTRGRPLHGRLRGGEDRFQQVARSLGML